MTQEGTIVPSLLVICGWLMSVILAWFEEQVLEDSTKKKEDGQLSDDEPLRESWLEEQRERQRHY